VWLQTSDSLNLGGGGGEKGVANCNGRVMDDQDSNTVTGVGKGEKERKTRSSFFPIHSALSVVHQGG